MTIVTSVFPDGNSALLAGEQAREVVSRRASIRILVPGRDGSVIETSVVTDSSGWLRVALLGLVIGIACAVLFRVAGATWPQSIVPGLLYGLGGGLLLAVWLRGELYPTRLLAHFEHGPQYQALVRSGRGVVTAMVSTRAEAERVIAELRRAGGVVSEGFPSAFLTPQAPQPVV